MPRIIKINHVAIAVNEIKSALNFWRDALGLELTHIEDIPKQESVVAFLPIGESEIELVEPTSKSSGLARFLDKKGAGLHHICFEVDDIEGILTILKEKQIELINPHSVIGAGGKKIAFIHPKSTQGVLVELSESPTE